MEAQLKKALWRAFALITLGSAPAFAQPFPRTGAADVPNGLAAPFVGRWSVGFPEGEGMINGKPVATCDEPIVLSAGAETVLIYKSPRGSTTLKLAAFAGRTSWLSQGPSTLAVWTDRSTFYTYRVDPMTGRANWSDPRVYRRCA